MTPVQLCLLDLGFGFQIENRYLEYQHAFSRCQNANFIAPYIINGRLSKLKNISRLYLKKRKLFCVNGVFQVTYFPCLRMRQGAIKEIENSFAFADQMLYVLVHCTLHRSSCIVRNKNLVVGQTDFIGQNSSLTSVLFITC